MPYLVIAAWLVRSAAFFYVQKNIKQFAHRGGIASPAIMNLCQLLI